MYKSPLTTSCQSNFIVLLTDGLPTADNSADAKIQALIGRNCTGTGDGRCLEEIAQYMYEHDLRPSLTGIQNVTTYTVGFGPEVSGSTALRNTAAGAGGVFYEANDTASLSTALAAIISTILKFNTSFTAPAVSVNAFNRTQNLNDLYVTVFRPSETYAWPGNIKKYRLDPDGTIMDAADAPAVEISTGFFRTTSQSFWTTGVDGDEVRLGGAANQLPVPASRNVYSDLTSASPLTGSANQVLATNATITTAMLGLGAAEAPGRDAMINWLRGADIADENNNGSFDRCTSRRWATRCTARPATVIYGGSISNPDPNDGVVFAVTNDGYLHAIDAVDGTRIVGLHPAPDAGPGARPIYQCTRSTPAPTAWTATSASSRTRSTRTASSSPASANGSTSTSACAWAAASTTGSTSPTRDAPTVLFKIGPERGGPQADAGRRPELVHAGRYARINVSGATQNALQQVLVFGGGYDTVQENGPYATDSSGNQIFMVDAVSGNRLWYAGPSSDTSADLRHASMTHSIPGDVRVFDITGDGFADRMYAADMGGRVWRFDIYNGQPRASLVAGGVFASLGNAHLSTHPNSHDPPLLQRTGRVVPELRAAAPGSTWRSAQGIAGIR